MGKLDGKVALITGGTRDMGVAHVRTFLAEGATVVFGDVLVEEGNRLATELGGSCRFRRHDVTDERDWNEIVGRTTTDSGRLDILVNNAGILEFGAIADSKVHDFRRILEVSLISQWLGIKAVSAAMSAGGSVVNISSVNGLVGGANLTSYTASKFGARGLTKSAALELGPKGIRVNSVHPSGVATKMIGREEGDATDRDGGPMSKLPIPRRGKPQEVSAMVLFLASDDASVCTGAEFVVDGGMTAGAGF